MNDMNEKTNSVIGEFLMNNIRTIVTCIAFVGGMYLQHQANTMKIEQLEQQIAQANTRLDQQYAKLDNVKLDKAVFEATIRQFSEMSTDIRQIRERLESMMDKTGKQ